MARRSLRVAFFRLCDIFGRSRPENVPLQQPIERLQGRQTKPVQEGL